MECILCHTGRLRPIRMQITMTYAGKRFTSPVFDAQVCTACGEEYLNEAGVAFLLFHRNQAPNVKMSATWTQLERASD